MEYLMKYFQEILYLGAVSSIMVVLILIIKKVFAKTMSPKWHYYIWLLLIIRLILPVMPESSFSALNLYYYSVEQLKELGGVEEQADSYNGVQPEINQERPSGNSQNIPGGMNQPIGNGEEVIPNQSDRITVDTLLMLLTYIWLVGMAILSIYTILINIAFSMKVRRSYRLSYHIRANQILEECKQITGIKKKILLYTTPEDRTPSLYSLFHSRILVSEVYFDKLSEKELKYIFLHELSHYKRKDIAINWILTLLQIVYFFHPLLWYSFRKIREDCEVSCDAKALSYLSEEEYVGYGSAMIKLIRLFSESNFIPVTAGLWKHQSNYKRRIIMITKFKKYKWPNTLLTIILILMIGLVGLTGCKKAVEGALANDSNKEDQVKEIDPSELISQGPEATKAPQKDNTSNEDDQIKQEDEKADQTKEERAEEDANKDNQPYYGDWVISKVIAFGQVGTYSKEDTDQLIGKTLTFAKDSATRFGDDASVINNTMTNPTYTIETLTSEQFIEQNRMTFDMLGIKEDKVKQVLVQDSDGNTTIFLIKNENTLILIGGGTYFELLKKA